MMHKKRTGELKDRAQELRLTADFSEKTLQAIWVKQKAPENLDVPLKGLKAQTYWLADPGLWQRVGILGGTKDIQIKTESYGTRERARGTATIASLSGAHPGQSTGRLHLASVEPTLCTSNPEVSLVW